MSTIASLSATILQNAWNQVVPAAGASQPQAASAATSAAGSGTQLTLGSGTVASPTYNSLGQMSSAQIQQLEQAINANINGTLSALFPDPQQSAASDIYSLLPASSLTQATSVSAMPSTLASQIAQDVMNANNAVTNTMASLFAGSSGSTNQSNTSSTDISSRFTLPGSAGASTSNAPTTIQGALAAMQNAITNTQGKL